MGYATKEACLIASTAASVKSSGSPGPTPTKVTPLNEEEKSLLREEVTEDDLLTAKDVFREELLNEQRNTFFSAYMDQAKEDMTIRINSDVLQRIVQ